ncbi:MAG: DNA double-strand break repair nuclease NurA [Candidatus Anstonellales archaeon]
MLNELKKAAEYVVSINKERAEKAKILRESSAVFKEALEKEIAIPVEKTEINLTIGANDAGLLSKELHGVDILLGRAVAVKFVYEKTKLCTVDYFPSPSSKIEYDVKTGLDEREVVWHKNLFRLNLEIKNAINAIKNFSPEIFLLDGSLTPLLSDRPSEDSQLHEEYGKVVSLYKELYSLCEKKGVAIAGVIKDSRGKRFMEIVKNKIDENCSDSVFLHFLLNEGERTFVFNYREENTIIKDLYPWGKRINIFYLKPSKNDRPLRIEFLPSKYSFNEFASILYTLSSLSPSYAYPAILIEADMRAALNPEEMESAEKIFSFYSGGTVLPLRRHSRPFR